MKRSEPGTKGWDVDLAHGEAGESALLALLAGKVEVKRDRQVWRTGNVVVEFGYKGEPSGIATTTADWWAFVLDDEQGEISSIILVSTDRLKKLARDAWKAGMGTRGGDNLESELVKIPLESLY